jgi:hypothetical protein
VAGAAGSAARLHHDERQRSLIPITGSSRLIPRLGNPVACAALLKALVTEQLPLKCPRQTSIWSNVRPRFILEKLDLVQFVERLVPVVLLVLGISYVLQAPRWVQAGRQVMAAPHSFLPTAMLLFVLGLAIVIAHNRWVADWPLVVTLFGWILVIKSAAFLFFPRLTAKADGWPESLHLASARIGGALAAVIGGFASYYAWFG